MKFNKNLQVSLLFCFYIARGGRVTVEAASANLNISRRFLAKIANKLRKAGILNSHRGPKGGYSLKDGLSIMEVITVVNGPLFLSKKEEMKYLKQETEHRILVGFIKAVLKGSSKVLNTKINDFSKQHMLSEHEMLANVSKTGH